MDNATINDFMLTVRSIVICFIPNATPVSRVIKLIGFILDPERAEMFESYGVQRFVEEYLSEEVAVLKGTEDALVHFKCKNGNV